MNVEDVQEVLEEMYEEDILFFTVSDVGDRFEEGSSSTVSSRLKNYENSDNYNNPEIEEFTKTPNSRIFAFSDKLRVNFPYFNDPLSFEEVQTVVNYLREDLEELIGKKLNKHNITTGMEFTLEVRNGKVEIKLLTRKELKKDD